jgi:hypothetical protein
VRSDKAGFRTREQSDPLHPIDEADNAFDSPTKGNIGKTDIMDKQNEYAGKQKQKRSVDARIVTQQDWPEAGPQREEHQIHPHFFAIIPLEQR